MSSLRAFAASCCLAVAGLLVAGGAQDPVVPPPQGRTAAVAVVPPAAVHLPGPAHVTDRGSGVLDVVPGTGARTGTGPLHRYRVEVEGGIGVDAADVAGTVERV